MPQNMQYVDGRMDLVMRILNVTKCITFVGKIEKVACQ